MNEPSPTGPAPTARVVPAWPEDSVPSATEAERALAAVLAGKTRGLDAALAARVQGDLTGLEREALGGASGAADPLRQAAALRWRLGAAIVTAPQGAAPFDAQAVQALLGDTDAILTRLKEVAEQAPEPEQKGIGAIRSGIVREAIALGNVVQRLAEASAAGDKVPVAKALQARVLSIAAGEDVGESAPRGKFLKLGVVLAAAALLAGGYHLHRWKTRPGPVAPIAGAPEGTAVAKGRTRSTLVTPDGKPLPEADLAKLREVQAANGMQVREIARGVYAIEQAAPAARRSP